MSLDGTAAVRAPVRVVGAWEDFVAGGVGGVGICVVTHPFDTVKVLRQTQHERYGSAMSAARAVVAAQGWRAMFRGMASPLSTIPLVNAIVFWAYGLAKRAIAPAGSASTSGDSSLSVAQVGAAGAFAGLVNTPVISPVEMAKIRLQSGAASSLSRTNAGAFTGPFDVLRQAWQQAGLRGVFRGQAVTGAREVLAYGAQFAAYEAVLRAIASKSRVAGATDEHHGTTAGTIDESSLAPSAVLFAGGVAGVACWTASYPVDVVKSRLQVLPVSGIAGRAPLFPASPALLRLDGGALRCAQHIIRADGWRGLWRGYLPCVAPAFPANAVGFAGYEATIELVFVRLLGYRRASVE